MRAHFKLFILLTLLLSVHCLANEEQNSLDLSLPFLGDIEINTNTAFNEELQNRNVSAFVKLQLEDEIESRLNVNVVCPLSYQRCIAAYESIIEQPLELSNLSPQTTITIYNYYAPRNPREHDVLISTRFDTNRLLEELAIHPTCPVELTGGFSPMFPFDEDQARDLYQVIHDNEGYSWSDYLVEMNQQECIAPEESGLRSPEFPSCEGSSEFYNSLFHDDEINITMVHGYEDDTHSGSQTEYQIFIDQAQSELDQVIRRLETYGFQLISRSTLEAHLSLIVNHNGRAIHINLRGILSSIACEDEEVEGGIVRRNRETETCPNQVKATTYAREAFRSALEDDEVVIYSGHSRFGQGPDFGPYHESFGKFSLNNGAMNEVDQQTSQSLLYVNSCSSHGHFAGSIEDYRQRLARRSRHQNITFLSNSEISYSNDGPAAAANLIIALLERQCPQEVQAMIDLGRVIRPTDHEATEVVIEGEM